VLGGGYKEKTFLLTKEELSRTWAGIARTRPLELLIRFAWILAFLFLQHPMSVAKHRHYSAWTRKM
jgi:hypothetical protein